MAPTHAFDAPARRLEALCACVGLGLLIVALGCGGGSGAPPSSGSPTAPGTPSTPQVAATITMASGVEPKDVRIEVGQTVRFVNNSGGMRMIRSDPHPSHGSCPPVDQSGTLQPGGNVTVGPFQAVMACTYHDHNDPTNAAWQGRIRIGTDEGPSGPGYLRP